MLLRLLNQKQNNLRAWIIGNAKTDLWKCLEMMSQLETPPPVDHQA